MKLLKMYKCKGTNQYLECVYQGNQYPTYWLKDAYLSMYFTGMNTQYRRPIPIGYTYETA